MLSCNALKTRGFRAFLATQFLGAFNDNAFKLVIFLVAQNILADSTSFLALAGALFTVPFIVFSAYAGFLADRFSKKKVMVWAKVAEIVIMILGGVAIMSGSLAAMAGVLFLMGTQSAFFGPAKYGFLPEVLPDEELSRGNGRVQMWTFLAIIAGTALAGPLFQVFQFGIRIGGDRVIGCLGKPYLVSIVLVAVAVLGMLVSLAITPVRSAESRKPFEFNFLRSVWTTVREVRPQRALFLCMMGSCYFWFLGALYQMNILLFAEKAMGVDAIHTGFLLTSIALGVGMGSVLAGRWSNEQVEFGLVPIGAVGLGVFSIGLSFSAGSYPLTIVLLFCLGMSCGFYNIPLHSYIQQESPADSKGRILGVTNVLNFVAILLASGVLMLLQKIAGVSPAAVFLVTGVLSFVVIAYIIRLLPDFLLRFVLWLLTRIVYRVRVRGRENLPRRGGALLVCNHVSYVDGLLVQACTQRFVRFLMYRDFYESKWLNPLCRLGRAIPVSADDSPKTMVANLRKAGEYLEQGELVCIFAEGSITRTGNLLPFNRGLEVIMKRANVPIIPVHLDELWGSLFSFEGGRILGRLPSRLPYPVTVAFGEPMPSGSTAFEVRSAVGELAADNFKARTNTQELLSTRFFRQARRTPRRFCMADSTGMRLSYSRAMIAAMALSRAIGRRCQGEEMVGIMLPNTVMAALMNVAVTILGKVPVNLNFTASEEALSTAIETCGIRTLFTSRTFLEKATLREREGMVYLENFVGESRSMDKALAWFGFWLLPHWLLRLLYRADRNRNTRSLATVMFSSGSTGTPKGVMLSHANINSNIEGLYQILRLGPQDTVLGILPLFHSFGFTGTLWFPLTTGRSVVFHSNPLDFKVVGELVQEYQAAILTATPTFLMGYLRRCTPEQFASLKYVVVGAEKLKERLAIAFRKKFGICPLEGYGCTELSPIVSLNVPDVVLEDGTQPGTKSGTIGQPLPGVAAKIVDPDTAEPLPCGTEGLLLIKGPNVMLGYLGNEEKTREVMHGDWYATGDIAVIDSDGFITITDRLSRFSKIGGEMVPHIKIEEKIHDLLGVAGEQVCVVTAVPDEKKGEKLVVLFRRGSLEVDDICEKLRASDLPNLWIPKKDAFHGVDKFPMLGTGKLDLKGIKAMAVELDCAAGIAGDDS